MTKKVIKNVCIALVCFFCTLAFTNIYAEPAMAEENGIYDASPISASGSYSGRLSDECKDYYKFTLNESGKVNLTISMDIDSYDGRVIFYDNDYGELCDNYVNYDGNRRCKYLKSSYYFSAGTYYIRISGGEGTYSFIMDFQSANETIPESQTNRNDILSESRNILLDTKYTELIGWGDTQDFYKFHVPFSGQISVSHMDYITARYDRSEYSILNMEGDELKEFGSYLDSNKGYAQGTETYSLETGDYYLKLCDTHGIYNFTIKLKPNPAQITRTKRNKTKATVSIEKQAGANGYVLQYSTASEFKKGTTKTKTVTGTKVKLTGLKKNRTYYLRVKAYKNWNGKTYYSEYGDSSTLYYY